jgi:hypothetical protein
VGTQVNELKSLTAADFNGDHHLDVLVVLDAGLAVYIAYGNGDGTFNQTTPKVPGTEGAVSAKPADVNSDGKLDLVVSFLCGTATFYGDGTGQFSTTAP